MVNQDADFGPAVFQAKNIARGQGRRRVVPGPRWVHIDQAAYDACRALRNYRPPWPRRCYLRSFIFFRTATSVDADSGSWSQRWGGLW